MAKSCSLVVIAALCLFSLVGLAYCEEVLYAEGKVYCDTCRIAFETSLTEYMEGANVHLECRDRVGSANVTFSVEGVTDKTGTYRLPVKGDHEEEICEVVLDKSSRPDCKELLKGRARARILMTSNNGIKDQTRHANSLGFLKKETLPGCATALKEIGLLPTAMIP